MRKLSRFLPMVAVLTTGLTVGVAQNVNAAVTFQFNYTDAAGTGFNDVALGQARRDALQLAADSFASSLTGYTATVVLDVTGTATGGTLAFAGSNSAANPNAGFGNVAVVRNKILSNGATDLNGGGSDGVVGVNFGFNWILDQNATVDGGNNEWDWYSTMYHEFAHAIGFSSGVFTDGNGLNPTDGFGLDQGGSWNKFDEFLQDVNGNLIDGNFDLDAAAYEAALVGGPSPAGGLFFNGPTSGLAGLYTPNPFEQGSSGSHLDDQNPMLAGLMMLAQTGAGPSARIFSALELNMLKDIGYDMIAQITPVPIPAAILLFATGLGLLGFGKRRRQLRGAS